ncbi:MAG: IS1595 family transposase [Steroidobacterales bacterium]
MAKSLTVKEFFVKFPDDDTCLLHVMDLRYGRTRECPNPKCAKPTEFYKLGKRPAFSCKLCGHHIYPCAGTPFERTRTPLQSWFYAIYLFTTSRHGVPAKELQRQLGVTYKTAWRMGHEIRKFMGVVDGDDGLSGTVEIDEAYVGGNTHKVGRPSADSKKTAVFGMVERGGDLMTAVVPNVKMETLVPIIEQNIEKGSLINSDEYMGYRTVRKLGYRHETVRHRNHQYVRGNTHTNTIEGFWSHFKCSMKGTHRSISRKHMQKYLVEFEFRFNLRGPQASSMFDRLIQAF